VNLLAAYADAESVVVQVPTTGPGSRTRTYLAYIFESFYIGSPRGCTGIGLAIVKAIVEAHGGAVSAENLAGGGASFQMWLPARVPSAPAAERDDPH
jgi:signal transduction histidine kinase